MAKTSIQVEESTRDRLRDIGKKGESYEDIIIKLLDLNEKKTVIMQGIRC